MERIQTKITRFFGKETANEQAKQILKLTEARTDITEKEKDFLGPVATEIRKRSRSGKNCALIRMLSFLKL